MSYTRKNEQKQQQYQQNNDNNNNNNNNNNRYSGEGRGGGDDGSTGEPAAGTSDWVLVRNSIGGTNQQQQQTPQTPQQHQHYTSPRGSQHNHPLNDGGIGIVDSGGSSSGRVQSSNPINIPQGRASSGGGGFRKHSFISNLEALIGGAHQHLMSSSTSPSSPSPKDYLSHSSSTLMDSRGTSSSASRTHNPSSTFDTGVYQVGSYGDTTSSSAPPAFSTSPTSIGIGTSSSVHGGHDKKCHYCAKDSERRYHQFEHEIVDFAQSMDRLKQYKSQQNVISITPPIPVDQDIISCYNQSENLSSMYYNILTQLDLERHNYMLHLTEILTFLDELERFSSTLDIAIFTRLGDNIRMMYDHLTLIKNDLLDTQNKTTTAQFKGYLCIFNHTLNNLEKSTQQFTLKFLHSVAPPLAPPEVLFTDSLKKYAKIAITRQKNIPLGCEWRITLTFTKSFLEFIKYCDPIKGITLLVTHSSSQTPQYFHVKNKPIVINEEKQFIHSVYHFCSELQSLLQKEDKFYLVYIVNNIKYLLSMVPKQTRELSKLEVDRLQSLLKRNPNTYLKEVIPYFIKKLYLDPMFFHLWNHQCIHLVNTKDSTGDINQLHSKRYSFILSFDEQGVLIYYTKANVREVQTETFTNTSQLLHFVESHNFISVILSNREVLPISYFNSIVPAPSPSSQSPTNSLTTSSTTTVVSPSANAMPHHITLCGPCISTLKEYLERMNREILKDHATYSKFIADNKISTKELSSLSSSGSQHYQQQQQHPQHHPQSGHHTPISTTKITKEFNDLQSLSNEDLDKEIERLDKENIELMKENLSLERTKDDIVDIRLKLDAKHKEIKAEERAHYDNVNNFYKQYFDLVTDKRILDNQNQLCKTEMDGLNDFNIVKEAFHITFEKVDEHTIVKINDMRLGTLPKNKVEWDEINGAIGQIVLLVHTIAKQLNYVFQRHKLIPMGNKPLIQSKNDKESFPLYGGDDIYFRSFIWSREHKFDIGLEAFLGCVNELCSLFKNTVFPFKIEKDKIGGSNGFQTIRVTGNSEVNWTKALKYMVTNIKYIMGSTSVFSGTGSSPSPSNKA
ncbi:hypothetical protein SAMD00019534_089590 [Acytostelium subglobosum LB1]|uniref:hypothetical protein n=1 Tax=Acytostelium subglobosum LB1 TaxID=1410327 RepID=UPI0006447FBB|nr:hypothetical protein SAMD00019534_089590 [Acytostelium subglobosum LB1]GAM25784.1 hypothetical protein SAMD00019534_089590 [Acytostelium subglobosum LB1]|eukprot:XP_012751302.1 hypothetical protein SAMD00019534_089590 [Acytostelium subglobosum LB1]